MKAIIIHCQLPQVIWTNAGILLNGPIEKNLQWNRNWNSYFLMQKNAFENVGWLVWIFCLGLHVLKGICEKLGEINTVSSTYEGYNHTLPVAPSYVRSLLQYCLPYPGSLSCINSPLGSKWPIFEPRHALWILLNAFHNQLTPRIMKRVVYFLQMIRKMIRIRMIRIIQ